MKPIWSLLMVAVLAVCFGGCATCQRVCVLRGPSYSQVVLTDFYGCWISEYIAEGPVMETCSGFCFRAVQRRIFQPVTLTFKYPLGRPVKVAGSHIIVTPACKPLWLQELDRQMPQPDQCRKPLGCFRK